MMTKNNMTNDKTEQHLDDLDDDDDDDVDGDDDLDDESFRFDQGSTNKIYGHPWFNC